MIGRENLHFTMVSNHEPSRLVLLIGELWYVVVIVARADSVGGDLPSTI
jgi:hypothetical protein